MRKYLLDTSAIIEGMLVSASSLKIFIQLTSKHSHKKCELYSIPLMYYEFNNCIRFNFNYVAAKRLFVHLKSFDFQLIEPSQGEIAKAIEFSYHNNTTYYDTIYHTVALSRNLTLLTMDSEYFKKASYLGSIEMFNRVKL